MVQSFREVNVKPNFVSGQDFHQLKSFLIVRENFRHIGSQHFPFYSHDFLQVIGRATWRALSNIVRLFGRISLDFQEIAAHRLERIGQVTPRFLAQNRAFVVILGLENPAENCRKLL